MTDARIRRSAAASLVLGVAAALLLLTAGCGQAGSDANKSAKSNLAAAQAAITAKGADAKLLVVQTAAGVTPTETPEWAFMFGTQGDNKIWIVSVKNGQATSVSEYGAAGLTAADWAAIPGTADWKVDSDEAYRKAMAASGAKTDPASYNMGFITYLPPSEETSKTKAFTWYVAFDPGASGATTRTIAVDAKTGKTAVQ